MEAQSVSKTFRFEIALSYPSEKRDRVEPVAELLAAAIGRDRVFYDRWYRSEAATWDMDLHLQQQYYAHSLLLVAFLSQEYNKEWCGLEWRVFRELHKNGQGARMMLIRFDHAKIEGLLGIDGFLDAIQLPAHEIAQLILERLNRLTPTPPPDFDAIVHNIRESVRSFVERRCGTIRVLRMEIP